MRAVVGGCRSQRDRVDRIFSDIDDLDRGVVIIGDVGVTAGDVDRSRVVADGHGRDERQTQVVAVRIFDVVDLERAGDAVGDVGVAALDEDVGRVGSAEGDLGQFSDFVVIGTPMEKTCKPPKVSPLKL